MTLAGWGNFPRLDCRLLSARTGAEAQARVRAEPSLIARGNGRSYGDAALNPRATLSTRALDRILAFDPATGRVTCEAGVLLADLLDVFVPRGWFPPVTPGTRFVTIGGMIAADVHGKNHHRDGSFGEHVESLRLVQADGRVVSCSATEAPELFAATLGGMGLTGVILEATFTLIPIETAWVRQVTRPCADLAAVMDAFEASQDWTYSVAWIDCLARGRQAGRSVLYCGEHARRDELTGLDQGRAPLSLVRRRPRRVPFDLPAGVLNRVTVAAFNALYYRRARSAADTARGAAQLIDYTTFFHPLDGILAWNRIYGRPGFVQYQCVLPRAASAEGLARLLAVIAARGNASFLAVLKLFGARRAGLLSFPLEGYTLALDFPATAATLSLLLELDAIVADHGGRLYLAKDARMGAALVRAGYEALPRFDALRQASGARGKFLSLQSERLAL